MDILCNGLQEDQKSKCLFEECLLNLSQGKKLQYGAANHLLTGLIRALCIENSPPEDEFLPGERLKDTDLDPTLSQIMANASSQKNKDTIQGSPTDASTLETAKSDPVIGPRSTQRSRYHNPRRPRKKSYAASTPEVTAPEAKNVDLTTQQSAINSKNMAAPIQRAVTENVSRSTRMLAGALCKTKLARSRNVGSST